MRKTITLILVIITSLGIGFYGLFYFELENEKFYQSPCESSAEFLIDSLRTKYKVWSSSSFPKNFCSKCNDYDSSKVDCKIISCDLRITEPEIDFQADLMIYNLMKLFWSFPQNRNVDSLYLTVENNNKKILTKLYKSYLDRRLTDITYDSLETLSEFKVIEKFDGTECGGGGGYEKYEIATRELIVLSKIDLFDYQGIADFFYQNELSNCKNENVATLTIKIITENPKGQFISEKISEYRFEIIPFTEYHKKINAL